MTSFAYDGLDEPLKIKVDHYYRKDGEYSLSSESDLDFYGYTECDYTIFDDEGNEIPDSAFTKKQHGYIREAISEYMDGI